MSPFTAAGERLDPSTCRCIQVKDSFQNKGLTSRDPEWKQLWLISFNPQSYSVLRLSDWSIRRKVRLIEVNTKCRHQKNWPVKGLCGGCLFVWSPEPHTPPHTHLFTQGRGGGIEPERRYREATVHKVGSNYQHDWLYLQYIKSDKHLLHTYSLFTDQYF
jgi:hypothetical protein